MRLSVNSSHNGTSITICTGDSLILSLGYEKVRTAWSFEDDFGFHPALDMIGSETSNGLHRLEFEARQTGTVEINLTQSAVLGIPGPSSVIGHFKLTVTVQ